MVWNKIVFTILFFVLSNCLLAQSTVDNILRQVVNDNRLSNVEQQLSYYRLNSFKSPALRELELRIRGNNLDSSPDNYSLRLGILNPKEDISRQDERRPSIGEIIFKWPFKNNFPPLTHSMYAQRENLLKNCSPVEVLLPK